MSAAAPALREHDPTLARVLAHSFESICREMGSAMISTAVSAVFVQARDFSCALLDARGQLVAAANYDPSHLSAMPLTAEYALMELGWEDLEVGDVIVVNDPYRGGGHLTDICVIRPIFIGDRLLGFSMNRGHHIDIGGMAVSGFPGTARSIYQEGIRIPPLKWFKAGQEQRDVLELILLNVRFPEAQRGDFGGQLASCVTAERRLGELVDRYGVDIVGEAMEETINHSERLMRAALEGVPDGVYSHEEFIEDDGLGGGPYRIHVTLNVDSDHVAVDFAGSSRQASGPVNSSYGNTVGSVFNSFLHTFGSEIAFNHGCFRPVSFAVPRGSLLNPIAPAPVFGGVTETSIRIIDAICGALGQVVPERVSAGCYGTCNNVAGGGWDSERRAPFGFYFFQEGGWGATSWRDGWSAVPNPTSNFQSYPVEVLETELPLRCTEVALNGDSGGAGRFRGGLGTRRTYEILADDLELSALGERFKISPAGMNGGKTGATSSLLLQRAGESEAQPFDEAFECLSPSKFASLPLKKGDRFSMITGGGGGFGDPRDRPFTSVLADVREGWVSPEVARREYAVVLADDMASIDEAATLALRNAERQTAPRDDPPRDAEPSELTPVLLVELENVEAVRADIEPRLAADPCRTVCVKRRDPTRCPFYHPFALDFWESRALEVWVARNCELGRGRAENLGLLPDPPRHQDVR